jgi:predicted component of type VI protein secretion system
MNKQIAAPRGFGMMQAFWLVLMALVVSACGGALEDMKQQVRVDLSVPAEVTVNPSKQITVTATAIAHDEALTAMKWTIEGVNNPAPVEATSIPKVLNQDCANKTMTLKGNDGRGVCMITVSIPDQAQPTTWKLMATATATSKGSASNSFLLHIRNPEVANGNFQVVTNNLIQARSNEITALTATAVSDLAIQNLQYRWVQQPVTGTTPLANRLQLAGSNSNQLYFVPIKVEDVRFTVTATGKINGELHTASADVMVLVGLPTKQIIVTITPPYEQPIVNQLITLTGTGLLDNKELPSNTEYHWELISPDQKNLLEPPVLNNRHSPTLNFLAKQPGTYIFKLTVAVLINGQYYIGESFTEVVVAPEREDCGFQLQCSPASQSIILGNSAIVRVTSSIQENPAKNCFAASSISHVEYTWISAVPGIPASPTFIDTASVTPGNAGNNQLVLITATPVINGYPILGAASASCTIDVVDVVVE